VNARPNPAASLISADWGTTSLRVYLLAADGRVLDQHASQQGVMSLRKDEFAGVLTEHCKGWQQHGLLPVLLSGMVGSRQGWVEAPYLTCPTGLDGLAGNLMAQSASGFSSVHIVPGLSTFDGDGVPDVMRGEECQIFGALAQLNLRTATLILPGTHSKRVTVDANRITAFQTFMTGEIFAALKTHTILGRMMQQSQTASSAGFSRGVLAAAQSTAPGAWLHRLFSVRTLGLMGQLLDDEAEDYLSGLMIGWELIGLKPCDPVILIGTPQLTQRYAAAAHVLGIATGNAPEHCVCAGHLQIARAAGLLA
jgi:2-dehydro-3-deoxygalactonokinase